MSDVVRRYLAQRERGTRERLRTHAVLAREDLRRVGRRCVDEQPLAVTGLAAAGGFLAERALHRSPGSLRRHGGRLARPLLRGLRAWAFGHLLPG